MYTNAADYEHAAHKSDVLRAFAIADARRLRYEGHRDLADFAARMARNRSREARYFRVRASMLSTLDVIPT
jgi:hypothetical protein